MHYTQLSDTPTSDPIPPHIHNIHQSLIHHNIITHPRVINCSSHYWKQEKYLPFPDKPKQLNRCNRPNLCPICSHLRNQSIHTELKPYRDVLLDNGGTVHLLTFTLRHHKSHPLPVLNQVLTNSIKQIRQSYSFKKFYSSQHRLFTLTQYEISWSEESSFHPHCHLHIGTTNPNPTNEIQNIISPEWRKTVAKNTSNRNLIPSLKQGINITANPSLVHSLDKKHEELIQETKRQTETRFAKRKSYSKEKLESILVSYDNPSSTSTSSPKETSFIAEVVSHLKNIYTNIINRFHSFKSINTCHPLFPKVTPQTK